MRRAVAGAVTGAALGAVGRAAIVLVHFGATGRDAWLVAAFGAAVGAAVGAVASLSGRPVVGAVLGAVLAVVAWAATLPVVSLFQFLGVGTGASVYEIAAIGALSGGVGAFVGRRGRESDRGR